MLLDDGSMQGIPAQDPTIYVAIPSKSTPQDALPDHENWFILVNAPALGPQWDWKQNQAAYRQRILDLLAEWGYDIILATESQHLCFKHYPMYRNNTAI